MLGRDVHGDPYEESILKTSERESRISKIILYFDKETKNHLRFCISHQAGCRDLIFLLVSEGNSIMGRVSKEKQICNSMEHGEGRVHCKV